MAPPPGNQYTDSKPVDPPTEPAGGVDNAVVIVIPPAAMAAVEHVAQQVQKISRVCVSSFPQIPSSVVESIKVGMQVFEEVEQRMTPWQREHWRDLTPREAKRRLDADDRRRMYAEVARRGARRRPAMVGARPREQRHSRSRGTRAGPSGDDPEPPAASPFQAAWRSALHLTAGELDALVSHAHIRIAWMRRWA